MVPVPTEMVQRTIQISSHHGLPTGHQKWSLMVPPGPPDGPLQGIPFAWRVSAGPSGEGILEQVILIAFYATAQLFYLFFSPFFPSSPPSPNFSPQSSAPRDQSLYQLLQMFLFPPLLFHISSPMTFISPFFPKNSSMFFVISTLMLFFQTCLRSGTSSYF